ncbi:immunoglobulin superfamily containing leucine-rich repeat protein [Alligator sinensis]|uniref:immunoglobulin superfamily containing leucine-rich repeat protein n=1 Tax=Alligator sinensis TaxID=38654 RepID=UPI0003C29090|nr:immunoglobulin superfamily containing leucine-rich repeat protein [Alligator sinensis]
MSLTGPRAMFTEFASSLSLKTEGEARLRGEAMGLLLCLCIAAFFRMSISCPEICTCIEKKNGRQLAECAYRDLQDVPLGLPRSVIILTLSANRITSLRKSSFMEVTEVQSLWLGYNHISTIEQGTFAMLADLKNMDLGHNQIVDFPWEDLRNISALQILKMNNNHMATLPSEAFQALKDLRSLWINDNQFTTIAEGTFDAMTSLSQLQLHNNPLNCSCKVFWLRNWTENTSISLPERDSISCAAPNNLRGIPLRKIPDLQCAPPSVQLTYQSNLDNTVLYDGLTLTLHCSVTGSPQPEISWKIQTSNQQTEKNRPNMERDGNDLPSGHSKQSQEHFLTFKNGTLTIPKFSKQDEGTYTCLATNDAGTREVSVDMALASSENPAEDLLRNHPQASQHRCKSCYQEDPTDFSKSGEKLVIIYHTPAESRSNNSGTPIQPGLWACLFCFIFLLYC